MLQETYPASIIWPQYVIFICQTPTIVSLYFRFIWNFRYGSEDLNIAQGRRGIGAEQESINIQILLFEGYNIMIQPCCIMLCVVTSNNQAQSVIRNEQSNIIIKHGGALVKGAGVEKGWGRDDAAPTQHTIQCQLIAR